MALDTGRPYFSIGEVLNVLKDTFPDVTVSRRHVEILRDGDSYTVRDVGSLNGTYVNRNRVEEAPLRDGDELQIGSFKLVFVHGDA